MYNIFAKVKAAVTTRQAAEAYGQKVSRNGMTCCPFHNDQHPSMKVDERYYCFACHETGDVIDFTAKLFGLRPYDAAMKLAHDFHIDPDSPAPAAVSPPGGQLALQRNLEARCAQILIDYECLLKKQQDAFAPISLDETWDPRFAEACLRLPEVGYLIDCLYHPDPATRKETAEELIRSGEIDRIEAVLRAAQATQKEVTDDDGEAADGYDTLSGSACRAA